MSATEKSASLAARNSTRTVAIVGLVAVLAGCSITSSDSHDDSVTKEMRCVLAHDEGFKFDGAVQVRTICDRWEPVPTPETTS